MIKPGTTPTGPNSSEQLSTFFAGLVRFVGNVSLFALAVSVAYLLYIYSQAGPNLELDKGTLNLLSTFRSLGIIAGLLAAAAAAFVWWEEEVAGAIILLVGLALALSPMYVPLLAEMQASEGRSRSLAALQTIGVGICAVALFTIIGDIVRRIRIRADEGMRADQLKFGKGVREEPDIRNVFMGKCWQLPYCRKFVREKCPIYHARRTCWKERVGCMCEESVINNAMEGKTIPKNAIVAARFIPYNKTLTMEQKMERCRQCVIYNEHQKHKYKLMLPVAFFVVAGIYFAVRVPLVNAVEGFAAGADEALTIGESGNVGIFAGGTEGFPIYEIIVGIMMLIVFAFAVRAVEYLVFKVKV